MRTVKQAMLDYANKEVNQFVQDVFQSTVKNPMPYGQYKCIREAFFGGMVIGNMMLVKLEENLGREITEADVDLNMQVLKELLEETVSGGQPKEIPMFVTYGK